MRNYKIIASFFAGLLILATAATLAGCLSDEEKTLVGKWALVFVDDERPESAFDTEFEFCRDGTFKSKDLNGDLKATWKAKNGRLTITFKKENAVATLECDYTLKDSSTLLLSNTRVSASLNGKTLFSSEPFEFTETYTRVCS